MQYQKRFSLNIRMSDLQLFKKNFRAKNNEKILAFNMVFIQLNSIRSAFFWFPVHTKNQQQLTWASQQKSPHLLVRFKEALLKIPKVNYQPSYFQPKFVLNNLFPTVPALIWWKRRLSPNFIPLEMSQKPANGLYMPSVSRRMKKKMIH